MLVWGNIKKVKFGSNPLKACFIVCAFDAVLKCFNGYHLVTISFESYVEHVPSRTFPFQYFDTTLAYKDFTNELTHTEKLPKNLFFKCSMMSNTLFNAIFTFILSYLKNRECIIHFIQLTSPQDELYQSRHGWRLQGVWVCGLEDMARQ